jgi:hypothetical protein
MLAASARTGSSPIFAFGVRVLLAATLALACTPPGMPSDILRVERGKLTLAGQVRVDVVSGELVLELAPGSCVDREERRYPDGHIAQASGPCREVPWQKVRVTSPWGVVFPATDGSPARLGFRIDWASSRLDALASDAPLLLAQPWTITAEGTPEPLEYKPDATASRAMLRLVGEATDTQVTVGAVSAPPQLVVSEVRFAEELRNGTANELLVTVTNQGKGDAYRLTAIVHSPVTALHGLRFSFGRLRAGETKTRRAPFQLPRQNDETEALIVIDFDEAHRYAPPPVSQRYPLRKASTMAVFALDCRFDEYTGDAPRVDAGTTVHVSCTVRNDGSPAHAVQVRASFAERPDKVDAPGFDLASDRASRVTLPLEVPRDAPMDSKLTVHIDVVDGAGAHAQAILHLEVARPQLCPEGRITRERFLEKRTELRKKLDAGLISKDDYDRYEAELVRCMKTE